MNWVKENKFLTGFLAILVIGLGVLGYEVYSASSAYEEANNQYASKAGEYNRLRHLVPYPNKKVLDALTAQKAEAATAISAFQADLAKKEFPVESISPEQFQDRLKEAVSKMRAKATEAGMHLPSDKFFLGFETYEGRPPPAEAAAPLGRQLKAIEWVVNQLIASQITELKELKRPELPEEKAKGGAARGQKPGGPPEKGDKAGGGRQDLVVKHPFDLVIVCRQNFLANVLDTVTGPKAPQFYILRLIRIRNQKEKLPRAIEVAPPAPVVDPAVPQPPAQPAPPKPAIDYIVGEEMVEAAIRLEMVDFAEVAAK